MKNWDKIGKTKALIIGLLGLLNLFTPVSDNIEWRFESVIVILFFGTIIIPLISKLNSFILGKEIIKPTWNDNPFTLKRPLAMFDTFSYFFIVTGLSMIIGTVIKYQTLSFIGTTIIAFGCGTLLGIKLTLKMKKT